MELNIRQFSENASQFLKKMRFFSNYAWFLCRDRHKKITVVAYETPLFHTQKNTHKLQIMRSDYAKMAYFQIMRLIFPRCKIIVTGKIVIHTEKIVKRKTRT